MSGYEQAYLSSDYDGNTSLNCRLCKMQDATYDVEYDTTIGEWRIGYLAYSEPPNLSALVDAYMKHMKEVHPNPDAPALLTSFPQDAS